MGDAVCPGGLPGVGGSAGRSCGSPCGLRSRPWRRNCAAAPIWRYRLRPPCCREEARDRHDRVARPRRRIVRRIRPDVVVLGAGLTGCLLANELVTLDPDIQVLLLEAGAWVTADHGQATLEGLSFLDGLIAESWEAGSPFTAHGIVHAVSGGSLAWRAWSPEPRPEELAY